MIEVMALVVLHALDPVAFWVGAGFGIVIFACGCVEVVEGGDL